ncbi:hypothetical protein [Paucibacter soli]|uniref:hypothetical protein n=1 Tax=Paucibacter soli TaxID=3133433 RepID=UPI00309DECAF
MSEFKLREWHTDVDCAWSDGLLHLAATNDYDTDGQALLDEFWDVVIASISFDDPISFEVSSVQEVSGHGLPHSAK